PRVLVAQGCPVNLRGLKSGREPAPGLVIQPAHLEPPATKNRARNTGLVLVNHLNRWQDTLWHIPLVVLTRPEYRHKPTGHEADAPELALLNPVQADTEQIAEHLISFGKPINLLKHLRIPLATAQMGALTGHHIHVRGGIRCSRPKSFNSGQNRQRLHLFLWQILQSQILALVPDTTRIIPVPGNQLPATSVLYQGIVNEALDLFVRE